MLNSSPMDARRPSDTESIEPNAPSVEAAFLAAPDYLVAEILEGELHLSPRPAMPHGYAASGLGGLLISPLMFGRGGPGGWIILVEPEIHLGPRPDRIVPDLAGWRRERMPRLAEGEKPPAHYSHAPDWVCEVLSPSTRARDKGVKMRIYAREGVKHLWHVEPLERRLDIYRLSEGQWVLAQSFGQDERVHAEPFEALELELALLWLK